MVAKQLICQSQEPCTTQYIQVTVFTAPPTILRKSFFVFWKGTTSSYKYITAPPVNKENQPVSIHDISCFLKREAFGFQEVGAFWPIPSSIQGLFLALHHQGSLLMHSGNIWGTGDHTRQAPYLLHYSSGSGLWEFVSRSCYCWKGERSINQQTLSNRTPLKFQEICNKL